MTDMKMKWGCEERLTEIQACMTALTFIRKLYAEELLQRDLTWWNQRSRRGQQSNTRNKKGRIWLTHLECLELEEFATSGWVSEHGSNELKKSNMTQRSETLTLKRSVERLMHHSKCWPWIHCSVGMAARLKCMCEKKKKKKKKG
jgi:hypothetical protein